MCLPPSLLCPQVLHLGSPEVRRAVIIVASQKTLPVAMAVLARLSAGGEVPAGVLGLAAMTCVLCHLAQTCFDFWLVSVWNGRLRDKEATAAAAAGQAA